MRVKIGVGAVVRNWRKLSLAAVVAAVAVAAFCWGRSGSVPQAHAGQPSQVSPTPEPAPPAPPEPPSDYSRRVVAYLSGNVPVTREQLGEYLIARFGEERLELFINNLIIEQACREKKIEVTAAEIEANVLETLKGFGPTITRKEFEGKVLKPRNLTFYEWKQDVIKPRLLLTKMIRPQLRVTDEDLQKAFDAYYGPKVECRLILWPKNEKSKVMTDIYARIRDSEQEFDHAARTQASPTLAAVGGKIPPMGHNTTGSPELEKVAFSLRPGELSHLIDTPDGVAVLKCLKHVPPDTSKRLEDVRAALEKEIVDKKVQVEIPRLFAELRAKADPKLILKKRITEEELVNSVKKELQTEMPGAAKPGPTPPGK